MHIDPLLWYALGHKLITKDGRPSADFAAGLDQEATTVRRVLMVKLLILDYGRLPMRYEASLAEKDSAICDYG